MTPPYTVVVCDTQPVAMEGLCRLLQNANGYRVVAAGTSLVEGLEAVRSLRPALWARKTAGLKELVSCFQAVADGDSWMEEDLRRDFNRPVWACRAPLTHRETEIMERLERGWSNRDIAVELGIQIGTVKIHIKHIFEKTGIRGRYGIAISSLRGRGWLPEIHAVRKIGLSHR